MLRDQAIFAGMCYLWEDYLRDPSWHPFKVISVGECHKHLTLWRLGPPLMPNTPWEEVKVDSDNYNFDAPICSPPYAPQQENTSVDCGVFVCKLMELLAYIEPIPKTLPKTEIDQFRADLVSQFLNDEGRSWTIKKWEARRMGKGSQ
ncbi:hypothetical protein RHGRI_037314 [Rhododendron griersonianum]|uniref:Ubiquitin-like protease family profile domain-containing protein n=1 Tax=Rhododendron griersonianum TaxID=479676 RepID=A0AAV6HU55_9ERIC|nr:hypothetical protein RHGRI_037314 [Rhododendron griersonianum]